MSGGIVVALALARVQHCYMNIVRNRWLPLAGLATLIAGPIMFSYPFLAAWNRSGIYVNPYAPWMFVDLFVALMIGCLGFVPLRFRMSTKVLMLVFYIPAMSVVLLVWSYLWCPLCDF
jgi:hypothetical protein